MDASVTPGREKNVSQTYIGIWRVEHAETEQRLPSRVAHGFNPFSNPSDNHVQVRPAGRGFNK
jgi:hypothetical protein